MRSPDIGGAADFERVCSPLEPTYPESHTAEQLMTGLDRAATEMLQGPDVLTQAVGEKLAAKALVKRQVEDMLDGADDITRRQEFKKLGIFVVREQNARFTYQDQENGFSIQKDDPYIELHLPPVPRELRSRAEVERSLRLVSEYVQAHGIEASYLLGITYEKLGKAAQYFGFGLLYVDPTLLPKDMIQGVASVYEQAGSPNDIGYPAVVYLAADTLTERYASEVTRESMDTRGSKARWPLGRAALT